MDLCASSTVKLMMCTENSLAENKRARLWSVVEALHDLSVSALTLQTSESVENIVATLLPLFLPETPHQGLSP